MTDPFQPEKLNRQFLRETRIGFSLVALVIGVVAFWGYRQYHRFRSQIPEHVRAAPIAKHIGPDEYLTHFKRNRPAEPSSVKPSALVTQAPTVSDADTRATDFKRDRSFQAVASSSTKPLTDSSVGQASTPIAKEKQQSPFSGLVNRVFAPSKRQADSQVEVVSRTNAPLVQQGTNPLPAPTAHDVSQTVPRFGGHKIVTHDSTLDKPVVDSGQVENNDFRGRVPDAVPTENSSMLATVGYDQRTTVANTSSPNPIAEVPESSSLEPLSDNGTSMGSRGDALNQFVGSNALRSSPFKPPVKSPNLAPDFQNKPERDVSTPRPLESMNAEVAEASSEPPPFQSVDHEKQSGVEYKTQSGDDFWRIAERVYGDGRYFRSLYELNRSTVKQFENLPKGTIILTPPKDVLRTRYPELCSMIKEARNVALQETDVYVTRQGDTLFEISRNVMGQASRYLELLELNKGELPHGVTHLSRLPANLKLRLPH